MDYAQLGRTGLKVSRLCLGTMNFGPFTAQADSFALMDRALALGVNFFDTANVYGRKMGEGVTEHIITAPIIGPRTMEQLDGSLRALEIKLSAEMMKKLDTIWPGPGGEAPEAYAW